MDPSHRNNLHFTEGFLSSTRHKSRHKPSHTRHKFEGARILGVPRPSDWFDWPLGPLEPLEPLGGGDGRTKRFSPGRAVGPSGPSGPSGPLGGGTVRRSGGRWQRVPGFGSTKVQDPSSRETTNLKVQRRNIFCWRSSKARRPQ